MHGNPPESHAEVDGQQRADGEIVSTARKSGDAVLVTGASTGIGRATALHLDQAGYSVFAGVRHEADASTLQRSASARLTPIMLDVTRRDEIAMAVSVIEARGSGLRGLVNNAGFNYNAAFEFSGEAEARALMETNLFGLCWLTAACLPMLRRTAASSGTTTKVINIGSIGSLVGIPWEPWYHASKFAVLGISESLHSELHAQRIRVCVVCPGGIRTPFIAKSRAGALAALDAMPDEGRKHYGRGIATLGDLTGAVDRFGTRPERVARSIERLMAKRNPPFRTMVGADARLLLATRAMLPASWFHALLRRTFGC